MREKALIHLTSLLIFIFAGQTEAAHFHVQHSPLRSTATVAKGECNVLHLLKSVTFYDDVHAARHAHYPPWNRKLPVLLDRRSAWGSSDFIMKELQNGFDDLTYVHHHDPLGPVFAGSLAEQHPGLIDILDDVDSFHLHHNDFRKQILKIDGYDPGFADYYEFYRSRYDLFQDGMEEIADQISKAKPEIASSFRSALKNAYRDMDRIFNEAHELNLHPDASGHGPSAIEKLLEYHSKVKGVLGEVNSFLSLPNVKKTSIMVYQMGSVKDVIESKMGKLRDNFSEETIATLQAQYPAIFPPALEGKVTAQNMQRYLRFVENKIKHKEIDLVRSGKGVTYFTEVKQYQRKITEEDFHYQTKRTWLEKDANGTLHVHDRHSKSMYDQMMEDLQMLQYLGLSNTVKLEYYAPHGFTPELKKLLKEHGVQVIEPMEFVR